MFGLSISEVVCVLLLALVVLGPKRLPEIAQKLGRFFRQLKESAETVKKTVQEDLVDQDQNKLSSQQNNETDS